SNERMVIRRWSDDGLVEVVPTEVPALARVCEVAALIGQPVITRAPLPGYPGVRLSPVAAPGGAALDGGGAGKLPSRHSVLARRGARLPELRHGRRPVLRRRGSGRWPAAAAPGVRRRPVLPAPR